MRKLLTARQASEEVGISYSYFRYLLSQGKGPRRYTLGPKCHRYDEEDVRAWFESHASDREGQAQRP